MTVSQIIACAISVTAAIVSITALVLTRRQARIIQRARREPVRWEVEDGMLTFDRKLTVEEVEAFKAEWLRRHGARKTGEEETSA